MANKTTRIDFNKERLYEILQMNGINSVRDLCASNDSLCYCGEFVSRKTIERACQTGKVSVRTLEILSGYFDCTPEFFTAPDLMVKEETDQCIVYLTDGRECTVKGRNLHWVCVPATVSHDPDLYSDNINVYKFYADKSNDYNEYMVAEICAAYVISIVRVEV